MKDEVFKQIDVLIDKIKNTLTYTRYIELDAQLSNNLHLVALVHSIKQLNKDLVKAEHQQKIKDIEMLEYELETKIRELYQMPLYQEYIASCKQLSSMIEQINRQMEHFLSGE